jgi:hypothetical protein
MVPPIDVLDLAIAEPSLELDQAFGRIWFGLRLPHLLLDLEKFFT